MPPEQRVGFAMQNSMPPQILSQLEDAAEQMGIELTGGRSDLSGGGDLEGEEGAGEFAAGNATVADLLNATWAKTLDFGKTAAFWLCMPAIVLLIVNRRNMSWKDLFETAARLPFSD